MEKPNRLEVDDTRIFTGSSNPALAKAIARYLELPLSPTLIRRFSNDNLYIQLGESVRGRSVFIVQSFSPPVNDHILELLMMLDAARSAGARELHAVIPYYSFARSDKKDAPRISITGRLIARLLGTAGATHVVTMTLHSPQVHGFFDMPTDPLTARPVFDEYFLKQDLRNTVVVSPDAGHTLSASRFAEGLGLPFAAGSKIRLSDSQVHIAGIVGEVKGYRRAIVYDDEIAAGSSVEAITKVLVQFGVQEITSVCTHGVFCGSAIERLAAIEALTEIVTTDTVPQAACQHMPKLRVLSVAPLFGEAIKRNYLRQGIGDLFTFWKDFKATEED
jgi:ribose-phosphate pyrophosphokinase